MRNVNRILLLAAVLLGAACAGPEVRLNKISVEVASAGKKHDAAELARLSTSISDTDLSPARLSGYHDETLDTLFATLRKLAFYSPDQESYALRLRGAFNEKRRRGRQTTVDVEEMFTALEMCGLFKEAAVFRQEFPANSLPEVPEIVAGNNVNPSGWQIYKISADGRKAGLQPLAKDGPLMIMVMHPGCEFAEMASEVIFADPELGPVFRAKGLMLTRKFEPDGIAEIKKKFNFDAVYIARKSGDFPGFSLERISPTFYFVRDGKILYKSVGWSSDDGGKYSKEDIRKGLDAIGLAAITSEAAIPRAQ